MGDQEKKKWQSMKVRYYKAKAEKRKVHGSDPTTFPFYVLMDKLMGDGPLFNIRLHGCGKLRLESDHFLSPPCNSQSD